VKLRERVRQVLRGLWYGNALVCRAAPAGYTSSPAAAACSTSGSPPISPGAWSRTARTARTATPGRFTARYRIARLVYIEACPSAAQAFRRERQLKGWRRGRKVARIEAENPGRADLLPCAA